MEGSQASSSPGRDRSRATPHGLLDAFAPRERALAAASLRIAVVGLLLVTNEPRDALAFIAARVPWAPPEGLRWLAEHVPPSLTLFSGIRFAYYAAATLAFIGVYTQAALLVLLASSFAIFAVHQLGGAAVHDMHLLWFLCLLVACRSGAALSVDEWLRTSERDPASRRLLGSAHGTADVGAALFFARTLLGIIYFFPGFWKLHESGLSWALSDNLVHQMHAKWLEFGVVPSPRIDRSPALMHALGLGTLAFELSFLPLVHVGPRTRLALAAAGISFHLGIEHFMRIPFASLWVAYVVLLPWQSRPGENDDRGLGFVTVVGAVLVLASTIQGIRGKTQSYPFACYPTFQWMAPDWLVDLELTAIYDDGTHRIVPHGRDARGRRTQREWGTVWSVSGVYGVPFSIERLEGYVTSERRRTAVERVMAGARALRAEIVWRRTDPEAWGDPPERSRELATITLGAP